MSTAQGAKATRADGLMAEEDGRHEDLAHFKYRVKGETGGELGIAGGGMRWSVRFRVWVNGVRLWVEGGAADMAGGAAVAPGHREDSGPGINA